MSILEAFAWLLVAILPLGSVYLLLRKAQEQDRSYNSENPKWTDGA